MYLAAGPTSSRLSRLSSGERKIFTEDRCAPRSGEGAAIEVGDVVESDL